MVLTAKQKDELHKAILGYLKSEGLEHTVETMLVELGGDLQIEEQHADMLEKKWSSIIRLQKKIMELESLNRQAREDLDQLGKGKKVDMSVCLPRDPARYSLQGHRDGVTAVVFHPVYSLLLSASEDATIKIWDYESGKFERTLQGHQDAVQDISFDGTGNILASCSADLSIKLWDFESNSYACTKTLLGHDHNVSSVRFVPTNDFLVSASRDKSIKLWEVATGYCVRTFNGHDAWVRRCIVSPRSSYSNALLPAASSASSSSSSSSSASSHAHSQSFGGAGNSPPASSSTSAATASSALSFFLASCSMDQTIRIWHSRTGECIRVLRDHDHVIETIAFSNGAADAVIHKWRVDEPSMGVPVVAPSSSSALNGSSSGNSQSSNSLSSSSGSSGSGSRGSISMDSGNNGNSFDVGGLYLISGSRDKMIKLWEVVSGICVRTLSGHDNWVRGVLFHPCGRFILSCSDDKTIRAWDLTKNAKIVKTIEQAHSLFVTCIDWNRALPVLASGGVDHAVNVWDCR